MLTQDVYQYKVLKSIVYALWLYDKRNRTGSFDNIAMKK